MWSKVVDPLSSLLLFIVVMVALSRIMFVMIESGFMAWFSIGDTYQGTINISHLLSANDALIVCKVEQNYIHSLRTLLLCFEVVSKLE